MKNDSVANESSRVDVVSVRTRAFAGAKTSQAFSKTHTRRVRLTGNVVVFVVRAPSRERY